MALQLITHASNGTKQITFLDSTVHIIKASHNTLYELRDTNTKQTPQKLTSNRRGKDLLVDADIDGQNISIVIEDYYAVSDASLIGEFGNGGIYPLLAEAINSTTTSKLPHMALVDTSIANVPVYGSDFVNVGAIASSGISLTTYAVAGLAVAGGVAVAAGGGGGGSSSSSTSATPPINPNAPKATITLSDIQINAGEKPEVRIVFSEAVNGFSVTDLVVPNGSISGLSTIDNITWTGIYTPTADTKDDTNTIGLIADSYTNKAGLAGAAAVSSNFILDTKITPPPALTVTIDDDEAKIANLNSGGVLYTFTFNGAVVGFDASDVVVTNGTKGTFSQTNPSTYTMEIVPTKGFEGKMIVEVPAGVVTSRENPTTNEASYQSFQRVDTIAPTVVSASLADTELTTGESTEFTVVFSEAVIDFSVSNLDMSSANGILSALSSNDGGTTWKALFTPSENIKDTTNIIKILNTYTDTALNSGSITLSTNYTIDTTPATSQSTDTIKPVLYITDDESAEVANMDGKNSDGTADANGSDILYTFKFTDVVNDFVIDDIVVTNGEKGTFTRKSDTEYTLIVKPKPGYEGNLKVEVSKDSYHDEAGNAGSDKSDTAVYQTVDMRAPFPSPFAHGSLTVNDYDVKHNRLVLTFDENLEQVNQVNPTSVAVMIGGQAIQIAAVGVSDNVAGMQDNQVFLYLDGNPTNARGESYDWINAGVTMTYIDISGDLPAIIHDLSGNDATSFTDYVADSLAPNVKIEMSDVNLGSGEISIITFRFNEAVKLNASDINLSSAKGTLDKLATADSGKTWTAEFTPTNGVADATNVISLNNTYKDTQGNAGAVASSTNFVIDTLAPKLVGTTADRSKDTITLTFDEVLDATNFSPGNMFTVTDGTKTPALDDGEALQNFEVKAVAIDGAKAILSIDGSIKSDANTKWTITYNNPSGNDAQALQDLYGSDVSSFTTNVVI